MSIAYPDSIIMYLMLCTRGIVDSLFSHIRHTLFCIFAFGLMGKTIGKNRPFIFNTMSIMFGYLLIEYNFGEYKVKELYYILLSTSYICIYGLLWVDSEDRSAIFPSYIFATGMFMTYCEHCLYKNSGWLECRGVFMIAALKGAYLAANVTDGEVDLLSPLEYFGYMLCPANTLFGPICSFQEYLNLAENSRPLDLAWPKSLGRTAASAFICLFVSTCVRIPNDAIPVLRHFLVALTFRMSHYFICYLSEFNMIAAGFHYEDSKYWGNGAWTYCVVRPFLIEFPQSLRDVINNWNISMYNFLRDVQYLPTRDKGQFYALFSTFIVSSMFHGFNIHVTAVLLSLSVFSYIQMILREKLARRYDACLQIRQCTTCYHRYDYIHPVVVSIRFTFTLWAMVDLAYLGAIMTNLDVSFRNHDRILTNIDKTWRSVGYMSHCVNLIFLIVSFFI